jgi:hypothetical protein
MYLQISNTYFTNLDKLVDKDTFPADYRVTLGTKEVMKFTEMLK